MDRREFLLSGWALMSARTSSATSARIDILPDEVIGTIAPDIYGHFTEHLGGCIYDGIWVGENSKIPNVGGIRKGLIDHLKRLKPPVIRWPGGCFADSYNWRDGVGPRNTRPRRTNFWADTDYLSKAPNGPQKYEPNQFGTNDFVRLCKAVAAEPYFAGNLRSGSARDFYEWIEYCNSPAGTTTMADLRAQGGDLNPFPVRFWGVGNESWGCGGAMSPEQYLGQLKIFSHYVRSYDAAQPLQRIAVGSDGGTSDGPDTGGGSQHAACDDQGDDFARHTSSGLLQSLGYFLATPGSTISIQITPITRNRPSWPASRRSSGRARGPEDQAFPSAVLFSQSHMAFLSLRRCRIGSTARTVSTHCSSARISLEEPAR